MRTLEDIVGSSPVFAGMKPDRLAVVVGCGWNTGFEADEEIFRQGAPAERFYLLRRGSVALEIHEAGRGSLLIETIQAGDVLGWSWLFPPYRWHYDARAVEPVRVVAFDAVCLRGKCEQDPALGYELVSRFAQVMIDRLQAARLRLLDVYGHAGGS